MKPLKPVLVPPVVVLALALLAGCAGDGEPLPAPPAGPAWAPVADGPLSPRFDATAVWSGREVLLFGGYTQVACGDSGRMCVPNPGPSLSDGAAYDPKANSWRPIAAAPAPIRRAETAVVGDTVYVLAAPDFADSRFTGGADAAVPAQAATAPAPAATADVLPHSPQFTFAAYHVAEDRWEDLPDPPKGSRVSLLAAVGDRIVAYQRDLIDSYAKGEGLPAGHDLVWDDDRNSWRELPWDAEGPQTERWLAEVGGVGVLAGPVEHENRGKEIDVGYGPPLRVLAYRRLDPQALTWSAGSPQAAPVYLQDQTRRYWPVGAGRWWKIGDSMVTVASGDGPFLAPGWVLDRDLVSSPLPARPTVLAQPDEHFGWAAAGGGGYVVSDRHALRVATREWREVPVEPGLRGLRGVSAVWAGDGLFAWGGGPETGDDTYGHSGSEVSAEAPVPRDTGWIWRPDSGLPAASPTAKPTPTP